MFGRSRDAIVFALAANDPALATLIDTEDRQVAGEYADDDEDDRGGQHPPQDGRSECPGLLVPTCGGDGDGEVRSHRSGLVEVLVLAGSEQDRHAGDRDHAAADAQESTERAGEKANKSDRGECFRLKRVGHVFLAYLPPGGLAASLRCVEFHEALQSNLVAY